MGWDITGFSAFFYPNLLGNVFYLSIYLSVLQISSEKEKRLREQGKKQALPSRRKIHSMSGETKIKGPPLTTKSLCCHKTNESRGSAAFRLAQWRSSGNSDQACPVAQAFSGSRPLDVLTALKVAPTLKQNIEAGKASGDWALGWR